MENITSVVVHGVRDRNGNKLYGCEVENPLVPIFIYADCKELSKVPNEYLNVFNSKYGFYDNEILDDKSFIEGIKSISNQINSYAQNDIQKVLLLDKMLRENVSYDVDFYYNFLPYNSSHETNMHKAHKVQSILKDRCAVCDAISAFSTMILNNLNIESRVVEGSCFDEHTWNEIKIGDIWYSNDFTHSLYYDRENGTKYTLVKRPSPNHFKDEGDFECCNEYDRDALAREMEKIKDIHITMPSYGPKRRTDVLGYHDSEPETLNKVRRRPISSRIISKNGS